MRTRSIASLLAGLCVVTFLQPAAAQRVGQIEARLEISRVVTHRGVIGRDGLVVPPPGLEDRTDAEVRAAMLAAFNELKLVVEPGGAVGLAAALAGKIPTAGRTIAVVCSGGNVDPEMFRACLEPAVGSA